MGLVVVSSGQNITSIGTTEYSLVNKSTTLASQTTKGVYQLFILSTGWQIDGTYNFLPRLKVKDKIIASGSQIALMDIIIPCSCQDSSNNTDYNEISMFSTPPLMLFHGWDFTLQNVGYASATSSVTWELRGYT